MPRLVPLAAVIALSLGAAASPAYARVAIAVDLGAQTMRVTSAEGEYEWPISSARMGYSTPRGSFSIKYLEPMHLSHKYNNAPMPHSMFFAAGYAIHGTYETSTLGEPASHGCIRIAPGHAALLYRMVEAEGGRVTITGSPPEEDTVAWRPERSRSALRRGRPARPFEEDDAFGTVRVQRPAIGTWLDDDADF